MAGLTITWEQRVDLARRLGMDDPQDLTPESLVRRAGALAGAFAARKPRSVAYEDTTGILRDVDVNMPLDPSPREMGARDDAGDVALDAAIARGAVPYKERVAWKRRYEKAPDAIVEVLAALPGARLEAPPPAGGRRTCRRTEGGRGIAREASARPWRPSPSSMRAAARLCWSVLPHGERHTPRSFAHDKVLSPHVTNVGLLDVVAVCATLGIWKTSMMISCFVAV